MASTHPHVSLSMNNRGVRGLRANPRALVGLIVVTLAVFSALFPQVLVLHPDQTPDLARRLQPPVWSSGDWSYPLGADPLGRDIWSRIILGARTSMGLGLMGATASGVIGTAAGIVSGYVGGLADSVITAVVEVQLAFPFILLAVTVIALRGPDTLTLVLILAASGWMLFARIVRARALSIRELDFIEAARAVGCGRKRILWRHVAPQLTSSIVVIWTLQVAMMIILESSLSFLGLGVQPPDVSWGQILADNRAYVATAWWGAVFPGLAITAIVLSVNVLGDWLSDLLDPTIRML
jgi:peptide/nickel transport system permease protein